MSKKNGKTSKNKGHASTRTSKVVLEDAIRRGEGKFTFANGDSYEGEYIVINNAEIYRHGYGVYKTSDMDEYRAFWDKDCIVSNLHIVYSNGAEYNGSVDENGSMTGKGSYTFPDGTSIDAEWQGNLPVANRSYKDPLGYVWLGETSERSEEEVVFKPVNVIRRGEKLLP